ncbi:MAG: thiamine ABC transporter substrate-binding protein [Anaerolineae bacterium]|nr:MAG: thiamine ABC transporter substrate-binding protein [Anaerolineae bacterium]
MNFMNQRIILMMIPIFLAVSCQQGELDKELMGQGGAEPESGELSASDSEPLQLTIMSHDSFAISETTFSAFESENNVQIVLLPAGDAGAALNQAILAKDDPLADVFFGVDNTFLSRALDADIFLPYESSKLSKVPPALILDESYRLLPVDFGDVCLNYDKEWFETAGLEPPKSLADLTNPAYADLLVVQNPATSSPGLAFLLATIGFYGVDGDYTYLDYWEELRENGVLVTQGWEEAYFGYFSAAGSGERPIVVSYASSPPAEVVFSDPPVLEPPTAAVTSSNSCFRQVEFVGILKGTAVRNLAAEFIDYMLDIRFQEDIPLNMFVFPANAEAELPEVFLKWAVIPEEPVALDPSDIESNREKWIEAWTETVLR